MVTVASVGFWMSRYSSAGGIGPVTLNVGGAICPSAPPTEVIVPSSVGKLESTPLMGAVTVL